MKGYDKKNIKTHSKKKKAKTLVEQKKFAEARELYQKVCDIDKRDADAWYMLGAIEGILGYTSQSINSLEQAIQLRPAHALSHYDLGISYRDAGRLEEAIAAFSKSVELKPDYKDARQCFIQALIDSNQLERAVEALQSLIKLDPLSAEYRNNLASVLQAMGKLDEAIISYNEALKLKPDMIMAWDSLGSALSSSGRFQEAIEAYRQSLKLAPDNARGHSNLLLALNYMDGLSSRQVYEEHKAWGEQHGKKPSKPLVPESAKGRLLRLAYVSPDFREHSVAYFIESLLQAHDKDKFEIFCYSSVPNADETTLRIKSLATHWRDISKQSVDQIVIQIRKDKIDVLIDLSGHTAHNHLPVFARKPAPVQITWLGYPNTTGLQMMDYRLVDNITDPEGYEAFCTEQLIRMPGCFICYKPPESIPDIKPLPCETNGYITFGSFNNLSKMGESCIRTWADLLLRVPDARLLIKNRSLTSESLKTRYRQYFVDQGIDVNRIIMMGHTATRYGHLDLYNQIDIALDTFPYNGTTTTCEALLMGVPVIALAGDRHAARVSASLLTAIGHDDLLAGSIDDFISRACALAADVEKLQQLHTSLRADMQGSCLCHSAAFARHFEQMCLDAFNATCRNN